MAGTTRGRVTGSILGCGSEPCIPPRETAAIWSSEHLRTQAVHACRQLGRRAWKRAIGYQRRSLSETPMYRFKQFLGGTLRAHLFHDQVAEVYVGVAVLNEMSALGLPKRA